MKCPNCQHVISSPNLVKCAHCGINMPQGTFEELQNIAYLQEWLTTHQAQLGAAGADLQTEVQAQRRHLEYQLGIQIINAAKARRDLALMEAVYARLPRWGSNANLSGKALKDLQDQLKHRIVGLRHLLPEHEAQEIIPEELDILNFALSILTGRDEKGVINTTPDDKRLKNVVEYDRMRLLAGLAKEQALGVAVLKNIPIWERENILEPDLGEKLAELLSMKVESIQRILADHQLQAKPIARTEVIMHVILSLPSWAASLGLAMEDHRIQAFHRHLRELQAAGQPVKKAEAAAQSPASQVTAARKSGAGVPAAPAMSVPAPVNPRPVQKVSATRPPAPLKPQRPPFNWGKFVEKSVQIVVSGALLRGLLYLGAFMIVISASILVVLFWSIFPPIVQAIFIFSVPTIFYAAGWLVRALLKLPQAGNTLSGIGALLLAVDFAAIYQFGDLQVELNLYWLVAGVFCAAIYSLTAWRLSGIFFDYIALLAGVDVLVALARLLRLPLEWNLVGVMVGNLFMVTASTRLWRAGRGWHDTARAARYLPQVLIPMCLVIILFIPGKVTAAQPIAFLLASLSYGALTWRFPGIIFAHTTVWSSVAAIGLSLVSTSFSIEWFGSAAALFGLLYTLPSKWLGGRIPPDLPARGRILQAPNLAGFILLILAIFLGLANFLFGQWWTGVTALGLAALVIAFWANWFHRPSLLALAAGLLCVPYGVAMSRQLLDARVSQWEYWLAAGLVGLALTYLGLAILLRRSVTYAAGMHLWVQILPLLAGGILPMVHPLQPEAWFSLPALAALSGMVLVYLSSAILHDSGKHPGLSSYVIKLLPGDFGQAVFLWVLAFLLPLWTAVAWLQISLMLEWLGPFLSGLGLVYLLLGQFLMRYKTAYRLPWHATSLPLVIAAATIGLGHKPALMVSLYLDVLLLAGLAFIYRSRLAVLAAVVLFVVPFQLTLNLLNIPFQAQSVAYALLASFGYLPLGLWLEKVGRMHAGHNFTLPVFGVGYTLSVYALLGSILGRFGLYTANLPWVGVLTPVLVTCLYLFSLYRFRHAGFAWASTVTLILAYGQLLTLLKVPAVYDAVVWTILATLYLLGGWGLGRVKISWLSLLRLPLGIGCAGLCAGALTLTYPMTTEALFVHNWSAQQPPLILAQAMLVGIAILSAVLYHSRWPLYLEPWWAFLPVTLFFVGYGKQLFGVPLTNAQFGLVWSCLGILHLLIATVLDPLKERYSHGLYLGGYALALLAAFWTITDPSGLTWTLGFWVLVCAASALSIHTNLHKTWGDLITFLGGSKAGGFHLIVRDVFLWLTAWLFPAWFALFLGQFDLIPGYQWLGFSLPVLVYLGLGIRLARLQKTYARPFITAGQFYTLLALLITARPAVTWMISEQIRASQVEHLAVLAVILVQALAVIYFTFFAAIYRKQSFAHAASWLLFFPYTLAWITYSHLSPTQLALPWMGLATFLLAAAFLLDRKPVRYTHGPTLVGYLLVVFALSWSMADQVTNLYVLGWCILLALASQLLLHLHRQSAYEDLLGWIFRSDPTNTIIIRLARILFLFFAAYTFPGWLASLLSYRQVGMAWQGLALAILAPAYIAIGLAIRRVRREYTWPFYSAAYALTAIGALMSLDNLALAIWVLALDAVVFAVSSYIFRQSFWLYLSNILVPVIAVFALEQNGKLTSPWIAGIFMGLAFLYLGLGTWFNRRVYRDIRKKRGLSSYALPFYIPGYLLSVLSLAFASSEIHLAIGVYLAGTALYALSAWVFRESFFLYPTTWLSAVPYYLAMDLTPIPHQWHGLGWLPLILAYIFLGRLVFHKKPLELRRASWLAHPAMPFYLLAYGLSVSMISLSMDSLSVLTLAFTAAAVLYLGSSALFRRASWLFPGLLAAHLALLSYLTISLSGRPFQYFSLPFLAMTWVITLCGYTLGRLFPPARKTEDGRLLFKWLKRVLDFGKMPLIGHLTTSSWAQPFFLFSFFDIAFWQIVALFSYDTTIIMGFGNAILLGLFAMLWWDVGLVYDCLGFGLLAAGARLLQMGFTLTELLACFSGIGFALYLVGLLVDVLSRRQKAQSGWLGVWRRPLVNVPVGLTALAIVGTLPTIVTQPLMTAASLAFAGALYLAIAYRGRYYNLGYLAVAMLEAAWILALVAHQVYQPQLYAIPTGLYLILMGFMENRRGRHRFSQILEGLGLAILLVTSFIQSLDGAEGFPYFVLLLVEALLVVWWGAGRRQKIPFFIGLAASVINVVAQVVVLISVYEVNRWFIILGVGLVLVVMAVFVERSREELLQQALAWRDALETWT